MATDGKPIPTSRIVYGVRSEVPPVQFGWLQGPSYVLSMRLTDPVTGRGVCQSDGSIDRNIGTDSMSFNAEPFVRYFVFDVPAGAYRVDRGNDPEGQLTYLAPAGATVYIGDYMLSGGNPPIPGSRSEVLFGFQRDLEAAKRVIGRIGEGMVLAESSTAPIPELPDVCSGGHSWDYIKPRATFASPHR